MSKLLETKETILDKLRGKRRTLAELAEELGLSKATVSQHLSELERMGAVKGYEDEHFRRIKYFEAIPGFDMDRMKIGIFQRFGSAIAIVLVVGVIIGAMYYNYSTGPGHPTKSTNNSWGSTTNPANVTTTIGGGGGSPGIAAVLYFSSGCTTASSGYCYLISNQTRVPSPGTFRLGVWESAQTFAIPVANVTITITSNGVQLYKHVFPLITQNSGWTASNIVSLPQASTLNWSIYVNYANGGSPIGNVPISVMAESNPSCRGCQ